MDVDSVAIIIVNYNGFRDTIECVKSIKKECSIENEIIIIDNNSKNEEKELLLKNNEMYDLILSEKNLGFSLANNHGIEYALKKGYKNILLLNNDTIITKGSIENMIAILKENKDIGMVSCSTLYFDKKDTIWFDEGYIDWNKYLAKHKNIKKLYKYSEDVVDVGFISGCCMLIRNDVFEKVGLLPTEYFMYFEDVDYCVKVKEMGYRIVVCKRSIIYHKVSASSGGEDSTFTIEWCNRNRIIFMKKYRYKSKSKLSFLYSIAFFSIGRIVRIIQFMLNGDFKRAKSIIKGCFRGLKDNKNYYME